MICLAFWESKKTAVTGVSLYGLCLTWRAGRLDQGIQFVWPEVRAGQWWIITITIILYSKLFGNTMSKPHYTSQGQALYVIWVREKERERLGHYN